ALLPKRLKLLGIRTHRRLHSADDFAIAHQTGARRESKAFQLTRQLARPKSLSGASDETIAGITDCGIDAHRRGDRGMGAVENVRSNTKPPRTWERSFYWQLPCTHQRRKNERLQRRAGRRQKAPGAIHVARRDDVAAANIERQRRRARRSQQTIQAPLGF